MCSATYMTSEYFMNLIYLGMEQSGVFLKQRSIGLDLDAIVFLVFRLWYLKYKLY